MDNQVTQAVSGWLSDNIYPGCYIFYLYFTGRL